MQQVRDSVFVETEYLGCNPGFVVTAEGVVMIDTPQRPDQAAHWRKEIERFGKIAYIINTDHHRDHALGDYYFNGDIIMHEGTMQKLAAPGQLEGCKDWIRLLDPAAAEVIAGYFVRKPRFTYSGKMTLYVGDDVFELIHVRSHTADETLVYMPEKKVLFTGDTVCVDMIPSMRESYPLGWLDALRLIEELDFEVLVPGHGIVGDRKAMIRFRKDFEGLIDKAREMIGRGCGRDEMIRDLSYEDLVHSEYPASMRAHFAQNMGKNIERLYDTLIKN